MSAENSTADLIEKNEEVSEVDTDIDVKMEEEPPAVATPLVDSGLTDTAYPQIVVNRMPRVSNKPLISIFFDINKRILVYVYSTAKRKTLRNF
jgi:hypothetical protein